MSPAEKGYFKKFNNGYSGAENILYCKLFDKLALMPELEVAKLERSFLSECKNLYSLRNFLQKQILKSLRMYHADNSLAFTLREMLDNASILQAKGLQKKSLEIIEKGLELSNSFGMVNYQLLFLAEKRQHLVFFSEKERETIAKTVRDQLISKAQLIINAEVIKVAHLRSIHWVNTYVPLREISVQQEAEDLYQQLKLIPAEQLSGQNEINLYYAALSNICSLLFRYKEAIIYQEKTIELMQKLDVRKMNRLMSYTAALFNICNLNLYDRSIEKAKTWLTKLKGTETENEAQVKNIAALVNYCTIFLNCIDGSPFSQRMANETENFLFGDKVIPNVYFDTQFLLLTYYMQHEKWEKGLDISTQLIHSSYNHSIYAWPIHVRLLNIMAHYKLGNFLLLPSLTRQAYRSIREISYPLPSEKLILRFFNKAINVTGTDIKIISHEYYLKFEDLTKNKAEQEVMTMFFDYKSWLKKEAEMMSL